MFNLEGEIGVLKQGGRQVAGVYDWLSRIILNYTVKDKVKVYQPVKHMSARSYWLVEPPTSNAFDVELYKVINGDLVIMDSGKVTINFPDTVTTNKRMEASISMAWAGYEP